MNPNPPKYPAPPAPTGPVEHSCRLILKSGEQLEINLSASQIKHMRRNKLPIFMKGPKGEKLALPTNQIRTIIPITSSPQT